MKPYLIYITSKNRSEALNIGRALLQDKLAACVNVLDGATSLYWWKGVVQEDHEALIIAKTKESLVDDLTKKVKELHSYECPCVVAVPIERGNPEFLKWIDDVTVNNER